MTKWHQFYRKRVNNPEYLDYFITQYGPFLDLIKLNSIEKSRIKEEGIGIGTVPKALNSKGLTPELYVGTDICYKMLDLCNKNTLPSWVALKKENILNTQICDYDLFNLVITHGVLEHFEDRTIVTILQKYVDNLISSVHYVPLEGHTAPSFWDERLLPAVHWEGLAHRALKNKGLHDAFNVRCVTFNKDKDLALSLELKPNYVRTVEKAKGR